MGQASFRNISAGPAGKSGLCAGAVVVAAEIGVASQTPPVYRTDDYRRRRISAPAAAETPEAAHLRRRSPGQLGGVTETNPKPPEIRPKIRPHTPLTTGTSVRYHQTRMRQPARRPGDSCPNRHPPQAQDADARPKPQADTSNCPPTGSDPYRSIRVTPPSGNTFRANQTGSRNTV